MYICICHAVTESQILQAAREGTTKLKDLRRKLGVSSDCGLCANCAKQCLQDARKGSGNCGPMQASS